MQKSRVPTLYEATFDAALTWFAELHNQQLLFHPEDDPADIVRIADGKPVFSEHEVREICFVLDTLDKQLGHEVLMEAADQVFMKVSGLMRDG